MKTLTTTKQLADYCKAAAQHPYVTIDTEFLRERTYYSKLCLIQIAMPCEDDEGAVLVDVLSGKISLKPLYDLFRDESVVKVFHAARQDLEIFFVEGNVFPKPFFDTQVAAMVCGFGEQVGYETLVRKIARKSVDKSSRFTDWSRRPLTEKQQNYALADVTHLREVYEFLAKRIRATNRVKWVEEELEILTNPQTYINTPGEAWKRLKTRTSSPRFLAIVRELARFRESHAQSRNIPRSRVYKDDALLEVASSKPRSIEDLGRSRLLLREARRGDIAEGILAAISAGVNWPQDDLPKPPKQREKQTGSEGLADLLRVLLKAKAEEAEVAQKLIATVSDLDEIAAGNTDNPALRGWRFDVFGEDALRLFNGKVALSANGKGVVLVDI
jgi:ribonuclease D